MSVVSLRGHPWLAILVWLVIMTFLVAWEYARYRRALAVRRNALERIAWQPDDPPPLDRPPFVGRPPTRHLKRLP